MSNIPNNNTRHASPRCAPGGLLFLGAGMLFPMPSLGLDAKRTCDTRLGFLDHASVGANWSRDNPVNGYPTNPVSNVAQLFGTERRCWVLKSIGQFYTGAERHWITRGIIGACSGVVLSAYLGTICEPKHDAIAAIVLLLTALWAVCCKDRSFSYGGVTEQEYRRYLATQDPQELRQAVAAGSLDAISLQVIERYLRDNRVG